MYGIPDSVKPLSAAEEQVMLAVWACRAPSFPHLFCFYICLCFFIIPVFP